MPDISDLTHEALPSSANLMKATVLAIVIATVLLFIAVLPAEFGIDPTGIGSKLGLTALHSEATKPAPISQPKAEAKKMLTTTGGLLISPEPYKQKSVKLNLPPGQGIELKATMDEGQIFVYNWTATDALYMDMHGEKYNAKPDEFTSYWESQSVNKASGELTAQFAGTHGWYWQNKTQKPVEINIDVTGFFQELYIP